MKIFKIVIHNSTRTWSLFTWVKDVFISIVNWSKTNQQHIIVENCLTLEGRFLQMIFKHVQSVPGEIVENVLVELK